MKPLKAQIIRVAKLFSIFEKRKEKMIYNTKTKKPFSPTLQVEFLISMGRPCQRRLSLWGAWLIQEWGTGNVYLLALDNTKR